MSQRPQDSRDFDGWTRNPTGKGARQQLRLARFVVEVLCDPAQFASRQDAREALFEALTDLARAYGVEPPDDLIDAFGCVA